MDYSSGVPLIVEVNHSSKFGRFGRVEFGKGISADLIKRCSQHAHESDRDRVVYLTIDEGAVQAGSSQRRGGLVSREVVRNGTSPTATPAHQHVECAGHTDQFESGVLLNDNVDDEMGTAYTLNWGGGGPADCALFRGEGPMGGSPRGA